MNEVRDGAVIEDIKGRRKDEITPPNPPFGGSTMRMGSYRIRSTRGMDELQTYFFREDAVSAAAFEAGVEGLACDPSGSTSMLCLAG